MNASIFLMVAADTAVEQGMTMNRRNLILASAGIAGTMISGSVWTAQPCPPQHVSVAGGTSVSTPCTMVSAGTYFTSFELPENPISEGSGWVNGEATGQQWSNVQTGSGNVYGSRLVDYAGVGRYSDPIAHLSASVMTFSANQYAQGTVHRVPGYQNPSGGHEIELLLRFRITANNARGYEVLWAQDGAIAIVRWNGPSGDYTALYRDRSGLSSFR